MSNRLRLLQAATALLYIGPLLAGLAGQGWVMIPLFTAIFVLWSVILRPHLWPATAADFLRGEAVVALAALIATQTLLVVLCLAVGLGFGGVTGLHPALPFYLPAVISFLSVPLSRLVWNPRVAEVAAGFDPLLHRAAGQNGAEAAHLADRLLAEVLALPPDTDEATLQAHLTAIGTQIDAMPLRGALQDAAARPRPALVGLRALVIHATDPDVAELLSGSHYAAEVFPLILGDDALMHLFATRAARAVEDEPQLALDCPTIPTLVAAAQSATPPARDALLRLAGLVRQSLMGNAAP